MAYAFVQGIAATAFGDPLVVLGAPATAGNLLVVVQVVRGASGGLVPTDGSAAAWTAHPLNTIPLGGDSLAVFYKIAAGGEQNIQTHWSSSNRARSFAAEYSGFVGMPNIVRNSATGTGAAQTGGILAGLALGALILGGIGVQSADALGETYVPDAGYTERDDGNVSGAFHPYMTVVERIAAAPGAFTPGASFSDGSRPWGGLGIAFQPPGFSTGGVFGEPGGGIW